MYADIKRQFAEIISHSQGIQNPELDELFDRWAAAKKKFIDMQPKLKSFCPTIFKAIFI